MSNITATTSQTIVSLLGTINNTANMVAKTIDSAASSVDMLDHYVQRAKQRQIFNAQVEDEDWKQNIIDDIAEAQTVRERNLEKRLQNDQRMASMFQENRARLMAKFNAPAQS